MNDLTRRHFLGLTTGTVLGAMLPTAADAAPSAALAVHNALALGNACHAFDHLGAYGFQAEAAAACGATVLYASGIGGDGYGGLPPEAEWKQRLEAVRAYTEKAHGLGIPVVLGYLCATSIVALENFDKNWSAEFRAKFKTPPSEWLQRDKDGKPLPSWYAGEYRPACMNHPDWRAYQKEMVRFSIETGHGGIFFDNPTVHPEGCHCTHCKEAFARYRTNEDKDGTDADAFRRFRTTIARDFLAEMRTSARTVNPEALITANNSTNSPGVLYSQCRLYGYSPYELSKTEDFVVIEDMGSQPRATDDGKVFEYGPTYKQLQAICHAKPLVVCTIADADYHTPPNLMRLAMAEAAANQATYMVWSTWPEEHRARLSAAVRKQVEFLRKHEDAFQFTVPRSDKSIFLSMRHWLKTDTCRVSELAAALSRANVQYTVFTDEEFRCNPKYDYVDVETLSDEQRERLLKSGMWDRIIKADSEKWVAEAIADPRRSITVEGSPHVRAYVHDNDLTTYVHLLNLDVRKRDSFNDEVLPAKNLRVKVNLHLGRRLGGDTESLRVDAVELLSADEKTTTGPLQYTFEKEVVSVSIPILEVAAILVIKVG